jgi:tubulin beta
MSGIINLHIGHGGNEIGAKFWERISVEHGIQPTGFFRIPDPGNSVGRLERVDAFYSYVPGGRYY